MDTYLLWPSFDWYGPRGDCCTLGGRSVDDFSILESIEDIRHASLAVYTVGQFCCCSEYQPVPLKQIGSFNNESRQIISTPPSAAGARNLHQMSMVLTVIRCGLVLYFTAGMK